MRRFRVQRAYFRKWSVRYTQHATARFKASTEEVGTFVEHWLSAGKEMKESMLLISSLNDKLTQELDNRKKDLAASQKNAEFLRNEQLSLAIAMKNAKLEIERLQEVISKSSMRYFVDIKPIHGNVVENVPAALEQYIAQKEEEKQRLLAERAIQQAAMVQKQAKTIQTAKRRKTTFNTQTSRSSNRGRPTRKSLAAETSTIPE